MQILEQKFVGMEIMLYVCIVIKFQQIISHKTFSINYLSSNDMNTYFTKEKLCYNEGLDLYIGKIQRKRLYCLNDVCRIFGMFFRDVKNELEKSGHYIIGIMVKRNIRCSENTFTDYEGLMEVLLMSRYDKSSKFKAWIDAIPSTSFKRVQKYSKRTTKTARLNANNKIVNTRNNTKIVDDTNSCNKYDHVVELPKGDVQTGVFQSTKFNETSLCQRYGVGIHNQCMPGSLDNGKDFILDFCKYEDISVAMLIFYLSHVGKMTRCLYRNSLDITDCNDADNNLKWIDDLQYFLKNKYNGTPYYDQPPKLVALKEKIKES